MSRSEVYSRVVEETQFRDYNLFFRAKNELERTIASLFEESKGFEGVKLIGSAATGTMTVDSKDLDYVVTFSEEQNTSLFREKIHGSDLNIRKVTEEAKYGYVKVVGDYQGFEFVLVPSKHPRGKINTYVDDAFYHPDFIKQRRHSGHVRDVLLTKEFFKQVGVYKQVQGISCELMALWFGSFDLLLENLATQSQLRINFSSNPETHSDSPLVVDYPFLGGRSLVKPLSVLDYRRIQRFAEDVLNNPKNFNRGEGIQ